MTTEHESIATEVASATSETAHIDLGKYRTGELAERIGDTIGIGSVLYNFFLAVAVAFIVIQISIQLMFDRTQIQLWVWLVASSYALVIGLCLGIVFGLLHIAYRSLRNVDEILQIILQIACSASADYQAVQSGELKMPTGGQLIGQVYEEVIVPTMEKVVAAQFRFLGTPLLWVYRRTVGLAVRKLIAFVELKKIESPDVEKIETAGAKLIESTGQYADRITRVLSPISQKLQSITGAVRSFLILPAFILFAIAIVIAILPILAIRMI